MAEPQPERSNFKPNQKDTKMSWQRRSETDVLTQVRIMQSRRGGFTMDIEPHFGTRSEVSTSKKMAPLRSTPGRATRPPKWMIDR